MGITNLNPFLKKKSPEAFKNYPYSFFKGKRVAVDSDNVLRKLMSRSHKTIVNMTDVCAKDPDRKEIVNKWLDNIRQEINKFLKYGITLIFVFDGKYIDEKSDTQKKRKEDKQKLINEAKDFKAKIMALDPLERTPQMVTELRKKMHHLGTITPEEKELVIDILKKAGFPVLRATEEGEKLCAMLCIEGKVDAVYSRDTDVVAMGCPLTINEEAGWIFNPKSGRSEMSILCTEFKPILASLGIEYETFLDLCIMAGCDFNSNIYKCGVGRAYEALKKCARIEYLPQKYAEKAEILNHIRCREIFKRQKSEDICQGEMILDINKECITVNEKILSEVLQANELTGWLPELRGYITDLPAPSLIFIDRTPSLAGSSIKLKILNSNIVNKNGENKNGENITADEIPPQKPSPTRTTEKIVNSLHFLHRQKVISKGISFPQINLEEIEKYQKEKNGQTDNGESDFSRELPIQQIPSQAINQPIKLKIINKQSQPQTLKLKVLS